MTGIVERSAGSDLSVREKAEAGVKIAEGVAGAKEKHDKGDSASVEIAWLGRLDQNKEIIAMDRVIMANPEVIPINFQPDPKNNNLYRKTGFEFPERGRIMRVIRDEYKRDPRGKISGQVVAFSVYQLP